MTTSNMGREGVIWFIAIVEDIDDPLELGRARIRPIGSAEELSKDELYWATPVVPVTSASLGGVGLSPTGIEIGSYCVGWYLDGEEKQKPIIIGTIAKIPGMDVNKHDVHPLARGEQTLKKKKIGPEPKSAYKAEYPHNKVLTTKSGHAIEIDDTPGQERIHIWHKSGTYTEINSSGNRVDKVVGDKYDVIVGKNKVYIEGDMDVEVKGDCKITISGNCTVKAKNVTVNASQNVKVTAKKIELN